MEEYYISFVISSDGFVEEMDCDFDMPNELERAIKKAVKNEAKKYFRDKS